MGVVIIFVAIISIISLSVVAIAMVIIIDRGGPRGMRHQRHILF